VRAVTNDRSEEEVGMSLEIGAARGAFRQIKRWIDLANDGELTLKGALEEIEKDANHMLAFLGDDA
jgi:hypothetical protein